LSGYTDEQKAELKGIVANALSETHVCTKEPDIAQLKANAETMEEFAEEIRETSKTTSKAMQALAVGSERLGRIESDIRDIKDHNEKDHTELSKRISNIGTIVEHEHGPIIDDIKSFQDGAKKVMIVLIGALIIGTATWGLSMFASHRIATETVTTSVTP
jgi:hypothetical protein